MKIRKIGIIKEGKVPHDFRVPLTPHQCAAFKKIYPAIELVVQPSEIRRFKDEEYVKAGITLQEDLSDCDLLIGVKEVPIDMLIPHKSYMFFSHTIKKQPHNAKLLRAILDKKIRLIDYETLKDERHKRLIGFGRYAGIVGAYEGFRAFGKKHGLYELISPSNCHDRKEMEHEMHKIVLPSSIKVVLTGFGRVGTGAQEIMSLLPIKKITPEEFVFQKIEEPAYIHLDTHEYYARRDNGNFDKQDFYANPKEYLSVLSGYLRRADLYISCHLWASSNPVLITKEDIVHPDWKCMVIADISCDVNGPIVSTIRASEINNPLYGYHRIENKEVDWREKDAICVMAIDNLPCELPRDASEDFGNELMTKIFPLLFDSDPHGLIWKASETTLDGELTPHFAYLGDYAVV